MKKRLLFFAAIIALATLTTQALLAFNDNKQQQRITISVSPQEVDLILKALAELPLKESGNLYIGIQQQAQAQLSPVPQKPKVDSTGKSKKP